VGSRVGVAFEDGGEVTVKNIGRPIRIWKWHPDDDRSDRPSPATIEPKETIEMPSIAVLPFDNMSGDPEQEYFSDGITEDLITDLSKVAGLIVIARNSTFAYKGKNPDIRTVSRDLGVRSVLEGSIRRAGNRVRITAQLIDTATGSHLWAERYDRDLTDVFEIQDEVTRRIIEALKVTLTLGEKARMTDVGTTNVEAHDLNLRARSLLQSASINRDSYSRAVKLLTRALELDPGYAEAQAALSIAYVLNYQNRWSGDADASLRRADELATEATKTDPNEPGAYHALCLAATFRGDRERAKAAVDRALALNPNDARALHQRGVIAIYGGRPEDAIPDIERALRLDPAFGQQYLHFLGLAHLMLGNLEAAATMLRERILLAPETDISRSALAATLGHLGQTDEARRVWAELKRVNPSYKIEEHLARQPFKRQSDIDTWLSGLAKAGLPG
jgi:adenylate cyclase